MGFEDYISENEAVAISGVSPVTLNRFAEAGYLRIESDNDGLRLFSKREVLDVFGIQEQIIDNTVAKLEQQTFDIPVQPAENKQVDSGVEVSSEAESPSLEEGEEESSTDNVVQFPNEAEEKVFSQKTKKQTATASAQGLVKPHAVEALEQEVSRLNNISQMQDRVLDMREAEIKSLKEERDWLRTRIERLEEKGDRDQLLLLSETQILRQMIVQQHQKTSPLRAALEWVGLANPKPAPVLPTSTIDLAKNKDS